MTAKMTAPALRVLVSMLEGHAAQAREHIEAAQAVHTREFLAFARTAVKRDPGRYVAFSNSTYGEAGLTVSVNLDALRKDFGKPVRAQERNEAVPCASLNVHLHVPKSEVKRFRDLCRKIDKAFLSGDAAKIYDIIAGAFQ